MFVCVCVSGGGREGGKERERKKEHDKSLILHHRAKVQATLTYSWSQQAYWRYQNLSTDVPFHSSVKETLCFLRDPAERVWPKVISIILDIYFAWHISLSFHFNTLLFIRKCNASICSTKQSTWNPTCPLINCILITFHDFNKTGKTLSRHNVHVTWKAKYREEQKNYIRVHCKLAANVLRNVSKLSLFCIPNVARET